MQHSMQAFGLNYLPSTTYVRSPLSFHDTGSRRIYLVD